MDTTYESHDPSRGACAPVTQIIAEYEQRETSSHPFFVRLKGEPVDLQALWILMVNLRDAISGHFVRWLAQTIARLEDRRLASLLAKQLNDELGNGQAEAIHSLLLDDFIVGLAPFRPREPRADITKPGEELLKTLSATFCAPDPYVAVGALMVSEIFAVKMDHCLGDEIRRQNQIPPHALVWLNIHEVLEADHASDSLELAKLVPNHEPTIRAVWKGARATWSALWMFLSDVDAAAQAAAGEGPSAAAGDARFNSKSST